VLGAIASAALMPWAIFYTSLIRHHFSKVPLLENLSLPGGDHIRYIHGETFAWPFNKRAMCQLLPGHPFSDGMPWHTRFEAWAALAACAVIAATICRLLFDVGSSKFKVGRWNLLGLRIALLLLAYTAMNFLSGLIAEPRTWYCLTPFILFAWLYTPPWATTKENDEGERQRPRPNPDPLDWEGA